MTPQNQNNQNNNANIQNQNNQINNAHMHQNGTNEEATTTSIQESNQIRAANFLQLANVNFVMRKNTTFKLSSKVSDHMSIQSYKQQAGYKDDQRDWQVCKYDWFANDLIKNNVPIGSGLTRYVDKCYGFVFLLGLHEAPYLDSNEGSLYSANQSREAGI
eukprot:5151669-Ditylum_brightwellii.AAC.1